MPNAKSFLLSQPVGDPRRGKRGGTHFEPANRPDDMSLVAERLRELGFIAKETQLPREALIDLDSNSHTGYFNRELLIETWDHHDFGTDWLQSLIDKAGENYRKDYLAKKDGEKYPNKDKALIVINDISPMNGGATPDHAGHQTGLMFDLVTPRKDGTSRRNPDVKATHENYDRDTMEAILRAFWKTGEVKKILFYDDGLKNKKVTVGGETKPLFTSKKDHKAHAHIEVKVPAKGDALVDSAQIKLNDDEVVLGPENGDGGHQAPQTDGQKEVAKRLMELGYLWAGKAEIEVRRHVFTHDGQRAKRGHSYKTIEVNVNGLDWAIRVFSAACRGYSSVSHHKDSTLKVVGGETEEGKETLAWLNAENAPRWQQMARGTLEPNADLVKAIRLFQAVKNDEVTVLASDGIVDPEMSTHRWLRASNAPTWVDLPISVEVESVDFSSLQRPEAKVPSRTRALIEKAATEYNKVRDITGNEGFEKMGIRHPGAHFPSGDGSAESGLRFLIRLPKKEGGSGRPINTSDTDRLDYKALGHIVEAFYDAMMDAGIEEPKEYLRIFIPEGVVSMEGKVLAGDPPNETVDGLAHIKVRRDESELHLQQYLEVRVPPLKDEDSHPKALTADQPENDGDAVYLTPPVVNIQEVLEDAWRKALKGTAETAEPADEVDHGQFRFDVPENAPPVVRQKPELLAKRDGDGIVQSVAVQLHQISRSSEVGKWRATPLAIELPLVGSPEVKSGQVSGESIQNVWMNSLGGSETNGPKPSRIVPAKKIKSGSSLSDLVGENVKWEINVKALLSRFGQFGQLLPLSAWLVFKDKQISVEAELGRGVLPRPLRGEFQLLGPSALSVEWEFISQPAQTRPAPKVEDSLAVPDDEAETTEASSEPYPDVDLRFFEGWRFRVPIDEPPPELPLFGSVLKLNTHCDILLDLKGRLAINFNAELANGLDLELGTPMVRLTSNGSGSAFAQLNVGTHGIDLELNQLPAFNLQIDPFKAVSLTQDEHAAVSNVFGQVGESNSQELLIKIPLTDASDNDIPHYDIPHYRLTWCPKGPRISLDFLRRLFSRLPPPKSGKDESGDPPSSNGNVEPAIASRSLETMKGELPAGGGGTRVVFKKASAGYCHIDEKGNDWHLVVPIKLDVQKTGDTSAAEPEGTQDTVLSSDGEFRFVLKDVVSDDGTVTFNSASFACEAENRLTVTKAEGYHRAFGETLSLHIPQNSGFTFEFDPVGPRLFWDPSIVNPESGQATSPSLRIPAIKDEKNGDGGEDIKINDQVLEKKEAEQKHFAFEIKDFTFHGAGLDLEAVIRANRVGLGDSKNVVFADKLAVHSPEEPQEESSEDKSRLKRPPRIGEMRFKDSRLVGASLRASAKLPYFDNATGTLGLVVSESESPNGSELDCLGTFDVTGNEVFEIEQLYARCEITSLHLATSYSNKEWKSEGEISGSVKFQPPAGRSGSDVGPLAELFCGVTVRFEDIDLLNLASGKGKIGITTPPKSFGIAEVMRVDLRGLELGIAAKNGIALPREFGLLGDITIQKLPGMDADFTFGGITLVPSMPPKFRISRIAGQVSTPGGFSMDGAMEHFSNAQEEGFAGKFGLTMSGMPRILGMLKLTKIRAKKSGEWVPSLALFLESDFDQLLVTEFYLRNLGAGIGLRQHLRGLDPEKKVPLPQRIMRFVDNPLGIPQPRETTSWKASIPDSAKSPLDWMFVGSGLITFNKLASNKPHVFAGSILMSIDQDLEIVTAVNAWLFTSPNETRQAEFVRRPCVRGAIAISTQERSLFAYFRTVPKPKFGKDTPKILADILNNAEASLKLLVDRHGFLMELGWPWGLKLGPTKFGKYLKGELRAGYRFGIYRGVTTIGQNFAIDIRLHAKTELRAGRARAALEVFGHAYFKTQFAGVVTRSFETFLLGDVRIGATVELRASLKWTLKIKVGFIKIRKTFSFSGSFSISIHAALVAALDTSGGIGFAGQARVSISICGFRVRGEVGFSYNQTLIDNVRNKINRIMPPKTAFGAIGQSSADSTLDDIWRYRFTKDDQRKVVRVILFVPTGDEYPAYDGKGERFALRLKGEDNFKGFVGSAPREWRLGQTDFKWDSDVGSARVDLVPHADVQGAMPLPPIAGHLALKGTFKSEQEVVHRIGMVSSVGFVGWTRSYSEDNGTIDCDFNPSWTNEGAVDGGWTWKGEPLSAVWKDTLSGFTVHDLTTADPSAQITKLKFEEVFDGKTLVWSEDLAAVTLSAEEQLDGLTAEEIAELGEQPSPLLLGSILKEHKPEAEGNINGRTERIDERTRRHASSTGDDPTATLAGVDSRSPHLPTETDFDREVSKAQAEAESQRLATLSGRHIVTAPLEVVHEEPGKPPLSGQEGFIKLDEGKAKKLLQKAATQASSDTALLADLDGKNGVRLLRTPSGPQIVVFTSEHKPQPLVCLVQEGRAEFYRGFAPSVCHVFFEQLAKLGQLGQETDENTCFTESAEQFVQLGIEVEQSRVKLTEASKVFRLHDPGESQPVWLVTGKLGENDIEFTIEANDEGGLDVLEEAAGDSEPRLSPGLMLGELLDLARHPNARAGKRWTTPASDDAVAVELDEGESFDPVMAQDLRLILEFKLDDDLMEKEDPIPDLIDLESLKVGGVTKSLKPAFGEAGEPKPEYDLILGDVFQDKNRICLTWDFRREGEPEIADDPHIQGYEELERLVVRRTNQSLADEHVVEKTLYPAWLEADDGKTLIRPQFQWVDDTVKDLPDGAIIDYEVEAWAPDRLLVSSGMTVIRRFVEPLEPVGQPLALQCVGLNGAGQVTQQVVVLVPLDNGEDIEDSDDEGSGIATSGEQPKSESPKVARLRRELRIRVRHVPSSTVGYYGRDTAPTPESAWRDAQPGSREGPDIRFPEPAVGKSLPWNETTSVTIEESAWEPISSDDREVVGLAAVVPLDRILLTESNPGRAAEIHVGLEEPGARKPGEVKPGEVKPLMRSPLARSRHAVHLVENRDDIDLSHIDVKALFKNGGRAEKRRLDSHLGNTVDAIELVVQEPALDLEAPRRVNMHYNVAYPKPDAADVPPTIELSWRHDLSGRSGFDQLDDDFGFNPVVAYEMVQFDRYDLRHYTNNGELNDSELEVKRFGVSPDRLYRARPSTIEVQGQPVDSTGDGGEEGDEKFTANWLPVPDRNPSTSTSRDSGLASDCLPYTLLRSGDSIEWPAGPVWLHDDLVHAIESVLKDPQFKGSRCRLGIQHPLIDRIADSDLKEAEAELKSRVDEFGNRSDPYGWLAAEFLGRSCEVTFYRSTGEAIQAERILEKDMKNVAVATFLADDGKTHLNVLRLTVASAWQTDFYKNPGEDNTELIEAATTKAKELSGHALALVATLQQNGRPLALVDEAKPKLQADKSATESVENVLSEKFLEPAELRLIHVVKPGLDGNQFLGVQRFRQDPRTEETEAVGEKSPLASRPPQSNPMLPIQPDGTVRWRWQVPDKWAHEYRFAVIPVRRYDLILASLGRKRNAPVAKNIDKYALRVPVDRTRRLVQPKAIATPIDGGFQAIILRHPASFAASASVDNQAYTQFDGQTVHPPERRVPEGDKAKLQQFGNEEVHWSRYKKWADGLVDNLRKQESSVGFNHELINDTIAGTEQGIFGADRYVFRDMPAYYEYRIHTSAVAGRSRSKNATTAWVSPLLQSYNPGRGDSGDPQPPTHQVPRIEPPVRVALLFNDAEPKFVEGLEVVLSVPVLQSLMPPELRPLWYNAETNVALTDPSTTPDPAPVDPAPVEIGFGFLPDLRMEHQLFLRVDPPVETDSTWAFAEGENAQRILLPVVRVINDEDAKYVCRTGASGIPGSLELIQKDSGALQLQLKLKLTLSDSPTAKKCLDALSLVHSLATEENHDLINKLIKQMVYVQGSRDGATSQIQFHGPEN